MRVERNTHEQPLDPLGYSHRIRMTGLTRAPKISPAPKYGRGALMVELDLTDEEATQIYYALKKQLRGPR